MSRSYRKHPFIADRNPFLKKMFNRRLRRKSNKIPFDMPNGGRYKRLNDSYDICDFSIGYRTYQEFYDNFRDGFDSDNECKSYWKRNYKCK